MTIGVIGLLMAKEKVEKMSNGKDHIQPTCAVVVSLPLR